MAISPGAARDVRKRLASGAVDAIVAEGLVKRYGSVQALAGVTFSVRAGEIFGLLGPNGVSLFQFSGTRLDGVQEDPEDRARVLIAEAADAVFAAAHPGDELGSASADAPVLDPILSDLNELEELLAPGIGRADTGRGLPKLGAVIRRIEDLLADRAGQTSPSAGSRNALRYALSLLRQIDFTGMASESQTFAPESVPLPQQAEAVAQKLTDAAYSLQWLRLSDGGAWMVQVFDAAGEPVEISVQDDPQDALLAVAHRLLPDAEQ